MAVDSAGQIQTDAQAARDDRATSQNPPAAPESADASGSVSPTPPNTVPSNAQPSQQSQPAPATEAPDKLPPGAANSDSTGGGTAQPTSVLPGTPQNVGLIQPALQSTATQSYIYRATIVDSVFEKGRFTQELTGALIIWPYDVQKAQSQSPQANPQRTNADVSSNTPLTGAQLLEQRENEILPSVVRVSSTPAPVAVNGNKLLQDYASSQGFTFQSRPLTSSSVAANSGTNMLTPLTTTPPTSGGQTVAPTFSEDVAQRKKQLTLNPQQGNREP
jgi:hypothetical protein